MKLLLTKSTMMKKMNDIKAKSGKVPTCANPACPGLAAVGWVQFAGGELVRRGERMSYML